MRLSPQRLVSASLLLCTVAACSSTVTASAGLGVDVPGADAVADGPVTFDRAPIPDGVTPGDVPPTLCAPGTWCWEHPLPQGNALHGVHAVSDREAWAVGDGGAIVRYRDGAWRAVPSPVDVDLRRVWGSSADDVWAWGSRTNPGATTPRYAIAHWNGAAWANVPFGALPMLRSVSGTPRGELWIATANGTYTRTELLRWNGTAFAPGPAVPDGLRVVSLCARSSAELWVSATDEMNSFPNTLQRWDGASWIPVHWAERGERINSEVACPADGVAVMTYFDFNRGTETYLEVRGGAVGGDALPLAPTSSPRLFQTARGDVYYANGREAVRWTPDGWQRAFALPAGTSVYSLDFDLTRGNAAGWLANGAPLPVPWTGSAWAPPAPGSYPSLTRFADPDGVDPAVVFGDGAMAMRTDGRWSIAPLLPLTEGVPFSVADVWRINANEAWLVGDRGAIARWNAAGRSLSPASFGDGGLDARALIDVHGSGSEVWAVGADAKMLRYDGERWAPPAAPLPDEVGGVRLSSLTLTAVDVASPRDVLVLGSDPAGGRFVTVLFRFDGARWQGELVPLGDGTRLARGPDGTVYAASGSRVSARRPGDAAWTSGAPFEANIAHLAVRPSGVVEVLVSGQREASLYELAPVTLRATRVGTTAAAAGIAAVHRGANESLWFAGASGAILRYTPPR